MAGQAAGKAPAGHKWGDGGTGGGGLEAAVQTRGERNGPMGGTGPRVVRAALVSQRGWSF